MLPTDGLSQLVCMLVWIAACPETVWSAVPLSSPRRPRFDQRADVVVRAGFRSCTTLACGPVYPISRCASVSTRISGPSSETRNTTERSVVPSNSILVVVMRKKRWPFQESWTMTRSPSDRSMCSSCSGVVTSPPRISRYGSGGDWMSNRCSNACEYVV